MKSPPTKLILRLYHSGLAPLLGRVILLLTTTGRKTGLPRVTPLQYEYTNGKYYLGAVNGPQSDWVRNIQANQSVTLQVGHSIIHGIAEPVTDQAAITAFLDLRLKRHPLIVGAILRSEGLPPKPDRAELEAYAQHLAMVIVRPSLTTPPLP